MSDGSSRSTGKKSHSILDDKIKSRKYNHSFVKELTGSDFKINYFQEHGFVKPILVKSKSDLGMRLPGTNFTVSDVKQLLGSSHVIEVTDANSKESISMTLKDYIRYYTAKDRDNILSANCIEFSYTHLESIVDAPEVVTLVDWLYQAWPEHLVRKPDKEESPGYPKMQRFCSMTVAGSFTDFHLDVGGTSVWYHVQRGSKIIWLIPPTNENYELYREWCISSTKNFFADEVKSCQRLTIDAGMTLFIPSGWIHAIHSPVDSLAFSGNFLHSFAISEQLAAYELECRIKDTSGFPFYCEMQWYVLERYVDTVGHVTHRAKYVGDLIDDAATTVENHRGRRVRGRGSFRRGAARKFSNRVLRGDGVDEASSPVDGSRRRPCTSQNSSPNSTPRKRRIYRGVGSRGVGSATSVSSPSGTSSATSKMDDPRTGEKTGSTEIASTPASGVSMRKGKTRTHLCSTELTGLNKLISFLEGLPVLDRRVPQDIPAPDELLHDAKVVLASHAQDDPKLAVTGRPVLVGWTRQTNFTDSGKNLEDLASNEDALWAEDVSHSAMDVSCSSTASPVKPPDASQSSFSVRSLSSVRRRRVRCRKCEACSRSECGECSYCKDMKKFGGLGRMKQTCISRQCLAPMLPTAAVCGICGTGDTSLSDEDAESPSPPSTEQFADSKMILMECNACWRIVHPKCFQESYPQLPPEGIINNEMPNSWQCPKCCYSGTATNSRARAIKTMNSASKQRDSCEEPDLSGTSKLKSARLKKSALKILAAKTKGFALKKKRHFIKPGTTLRTVKRMRCDESETQSHSVLSRAQLLKLRHDKLQQKKAWDATTYHENADIDPSAYSAPNDMSPQLANLILPNMAAVRKFVVRPAPIPPPPKYVVTLGDKHHALDIDLWVRVFGFLDAADLARCMAVCKAWNRWGYDRRLWRTINLSRCRIRQTHLVGIVRRQPRTLDLSWTNVSHQQLRWLAERLPHLRQLQLAGNSWPAVSALCGCRCPLLVSLNISWVSGVYDACIRDLVSAPRDHRPGLDASSSRFRRCSRLSLAGTDVTDDSLEAIAKHLSLLEHLDLSYCVGIGDDAIRILSEFPAADTLVSVVLTGCVYVTNECFRYLDRFSRLRRVSIEACPDVDESACVAFVNARANCVVTYKEFIRYVK